MSKEIKKRIYLASLLHNIGEFFHLANSEEAGQSPFMSEANKTESVFYPLIDEEERDNIHILRLAHFFESYKSIFNRLSSDENLLEMSNPDELAYLSAAHYLPEEKLSEAGRIVKKASLLSSGIKKSGENKKDNSPSEKINKSQPENKQMSSLFEYLHIKENRPNRFYIPVETLSLNGSTFPSESKNNSPDYATLWGHFVEEFSGIQTSDYDVFSETLLALLNKYTWCIPANNGVCSDISLFDQSKTTAALAVALYDYQQSSQKGATPFLLIGGDLSGIQNYIYQIASKYAGRNLKGRSFYIYLLTNTLVRYLLRTLDLYQAQVVYSSGGSFYILAPNTLEVKEKLDYAILKIEQHLFTDHGTSLYVSIDSVELSENALTNEKGESLKFVWDNLFLRRDACKQRKFISLLESQYRDFFEPINIATDKVKAADAISGEEFRADERIHKLPDTDYFVNEITLQQIELGRVLSDIQYVIVANQKISSWGKNKIVCLEPAKLQTYYYFPTRNEISQLKNDLKELQQSVSVIKINGNEEDCDFLNGKEFGHNHVYSFSFYGGNEKRHNSFEDFCKRLDAQTGILRMGVLRMDVDNLGKVFREGIPDRLSSLSSYSALSRSFDYFFSGYINTVWREVDPEQTFVLYSGGDDLFIVGAWQSVIRFGERIREEFARYTCYNSKLSLSGGMSILENKYPIMRGAQESGDLEKMAKEHSCQGLKKDAFCILSMPLNWQHEYPAVKQLKDQIVMALKSGLSKSFLSKILQHHSNAQIKDNEIQEYKTFWMMSYDLGRMKHRERKWELLIDHCLKDIYSPGYLLGKKITTKYHPLELWAFAARWAELEVRTAK